MVRISDGCMSGTAYGTVILHGTQKLPEAAPIVPVRNGDLIELDIAGRIDLLVTSEELGRRCTETPPTPRRHRPAADAASTPNTSSKLTQAPTSTSSNSLGHRPNTGRCACRQLHPCRLKPRGARRMKCSSVRPQVRSGDTD
jgi:dihydroxyacid dehydratase/phosphogluconate dehydratase